VEEAQAPRQAWRFAAVRRHGRRWVLAGAAGTLVVTAATGGVAYAAQSPAAAQTAAATASTQAHSLGAITGKWNCQAWTARQPGVTRPAAYTIKPILDGKFYQWNADEPAANGQPAFTSLSVSGWDPATKDFSEFYSDSGGNQATGSSPGWVNGHLIYTSHIDSANGSQATAQDDFTQSDRDHLTDVYSGQQKGKWVTAGGLNCTRAGT
jgi:hypothetical protein